MKKRSYERNLRNRSQVIVKMEPELHKRFKVLAARKGMSMAGLVRQFVIRWLEENEGDE